ncbi:MAG TPA: phytanoyl-CoA dioxygenase family protein [Gemmatimonadales bacterium]|nr:phytanoyl-CoA dioxygenase family protein [Gemmatimonadales bacterium]
MTHLLARDAAEDLGVRYWRDGYAVVPGRFRSGEIEAWRRECDRLWGMIGDAPEAARVQWRGHAARGSVADRIDPVVDISPVFDALARDPRLLGPVRAVLRAEPALMKAKLITKRPGTAGYTMHQDFPYWAPLGIPADDLLTVQVAIDPSRAENGAVELFGRLHHDRLPASAGEPLDVDESRMDLSGGEIVELAAGDLLVFHSLAPHRSAPNRSAASRRALFLTYSTTAHGDVYARYHRHQRTRG